MASTKFKLDDHFEKQDPFEESKKHIRIALFLSALLMFVLFVLPTFLDKPESQNVVNISRQQEQTKDEKKLNSVEKSLETDRKKTQSALRKALVSVDTLENLTPEIWAKSDWSEIKEIIDQGQLNYRTKHYTSALENFIAVEKRAKRLVKKLPLLIDNLVAEGNLALQTQDSTGAYQAFDKILKIRPNHSHARRGLERAVNLDKVFSLIEQGKSFEKMNALDKAKSALQEALRIDPESTAARATIERLKLSEKEKEYYNLMSKGYKNLNRKLFNEAEKSFISAYKLFGNREAPMRAVDEVKNTKINYDIENYEEKAIQAKINENWQDAYQNFSQILKIDSSLRRAKKEREIARTRVRLEKQMLGYLNEPLLLLNEKVYRKAETVLSKAKKERPRGAKLSKQISEMENVLILSRKPITVLIRSDGKTSVDLSRNGELGVFLEKSINLRPGEYTLVGRRRGYKECRKTFALQPGQSTKITKMICREEVIT